MDFFSRLRRLLKPKILVVEDSPENLELLRDILTAGGYRVTTAADGVRGLACYKKNKFDLVVLDYNMPRMGGSEFLQLIRVLPGGQELPVIILSAEPMLKPIYAAYEQGIVEWIPKPIAPGVLLAKVTSHLNASRK